MFGSKAEPKKPAQFETSFIPHQLGAVAGKYEWWYEVNRQIRPETALQDIFLWPYKVLVKYKKSGREVDESRITDQKGLFYMARGISTLQNSDYDLWNNGSQWMPTWEDENINE